MSTVSIMLTSSMMMRSHSKGLSRLRLNPSRFKIKLQQTVDSGGGAVADLGHALGVPSVGAAKTIFPSQLGADG